MKKILSYMITCVCIAFSCMATTSCSKDDDAVDDGINTMPITLNYGASLNIADRGIPGLVSTNDFIASVSNNVLKANHVGTTILSSNGYSIIVTVKRTNNFIDEPCTDFGATKSEVRKKHKVGVEMPTSSASKGGLMYKVVDSDGKTKYLYVYIFDNDRLSSSGVYVPITEADNMVNWLSQKYHMMDINKSTGLAEGGYDANSLESAKKCFGISIEEIKTPAFNMLMEKNCLVIFMSTTKQ